MVAAKKRRKLKDPAETRESANAAEAPPPPPELYSPDLLYHREKALADAKAAEFHRWLLWEAAKNGQPLDDAIRAITLLVAFVEWNFYVRRLIGWECRNEGRPVPHIEIPGDRSEPHYPTTEREAYALGLHIEREQPAACYPGCNGADVNGGKCGGLREYGHDLCPSCEAKAEYEAWERQQGG